MIQISIRSKLTLHSSLIICALLFFNTNMMAQESDSSKATLIYIGDPMCSWCYGFAPEIEKIEQHFDELNFEIVLGGLRPYGKKTMGEMSEFLKKHWKEIEEETFQPFQYDILKLTDYVYDTEPASRAVETARQMNPAVTLDFFKAVQTAFYHQNKSTHDVNTYLEIAKSFDLDTVEFEKLYYSKAIIDLTRANFERSAEMGVRGFPTLALQKGDQYYMITNGYQEAEGLIKKIEEVIE